MSLDNFCKSGDPEHLVGLMYADMEFLLDCARRAQEKYPDPKSKFHQKASVILAFLGPSRVSKACSFHLLKNISASCYLDSVLFALFATKSAFVRQKLLIEKPRVSESCTEETLESIQKNLRAIYSSIHGGTPVDYCTALRHSFKKCSSGRDNYSKGGIREAGDFLSFLFGFFDTNKAVRRTRTYSSNSMKLINYKKRLEHERIDQNGSVVQVVTPSMLSRSKNANIDDFLTTEEDTGFVEEKFKFTEPEVHYSNRMILVNELYSTPFLVINLSRINASHRFISKRVHPLEFLSTPDKSRFELIAVVVYAKSHYMTYFKCNGNWLFYDDTLSVVHPIGTFDDLLQANPNPATNGTVFLYDSQA